VSQGVHRTRFVCNRQTRQSPSKQGQGQPVANLSECCDLRRCDCRGATASLPPVRPGGGPIGDHRPRCGHRLNRSLPPQRQRAATTANLSRRSSSHAAPAPGRGQPGAHSSRWPGARESSPGWRTSGGTWGSAGSGWAAAGCRSRTPQEGRCWSHRGRWSRFPALPGWEVPGRGVWRLTGAAPGCWLWPSWLTSGTRSRVL
jgi:hypothetical protein